MSCLLTDIFYCSDSHQLRNIFVFDLDDCKFKASRLQINKKN